MGVIEVAFVGGAEGPWRVLRSEAVIGAGLPSARAVRVIEGEGTPEGDPAWVLRGVTSNERYVSVRDRHRLEAVQQPLGRPEATRAALIPVKKSAEWWSLTQEDRLAVLAERSDHIGIGLEYLPAVARRLHHGRDLGEEFDFLTWFEFAPEHAEAFEELARRLRATEEWRFVEREVDIRLARDRR
ncbi:MAG: chlorite dismutase family protein [Actinomycetota bacterium]